MLIFTETKHKSMKIKIEKKESISTFTEVELPYYTKSNCHFFKIYSDKHCIKITELKGYESISIQDAGLAIGHSDVISNEAEFKKSFRRISNIIKSRV